MRRNVFCASAARLPNAIDTIASAPMTAAESRASGTSVTMRTSASTTAAFTSDASSAVTGSRAPA